MVGAEKGRLGTERGGGAWCPAHLISRASDQEWLEVELARETLVTGSSPRAGTRGATYSKVEILLGSGMVTRRVRVIPISKHPRIVCLRIELLGCSAEGETNLGFL